MLLECAYDQGSHIVMNMDLVERHDLGEQDSFEVSVNE